MPKKGERTWTDDQLRAAVASSTTYIDVLRELGLTPRGRNHRNIQERIGQLGLDTSHFTICSRGFTDEQLRAVVPRPSSNSGSSERTRTQPACGGSAPSASTRPTTLRALGLIPAGGNYDRLQRRIRELGIDTSHFTGMGWNKGGKFMPRPPRPLEEILVAGQWTIESQLEGATDPRRARGGSLRALGGPSERQMAGFRSSSIMSTGIRATTGSRTFGSCARTATRFTHRGLNQRRCKSS